MKKFLITITLILGLSSFASAAIIDDSISWMYDNNLTIYDNADDFNANKGLRRDEAAKFFVEFAKLLGKTDYIKTDNQCKFTDINDSRSDLKNIVIESCKLGLFQGSKGKFYPKGQLTNAQAITVLVRLLAGKQNEVGLSHRANNYYTKANELGILQSVSMNNKENITTRGNVGIIIWNGKNIQGGDTTRNRYNSSLGFSIMLPGECSDGTSQGGYENIVYHWIENLNYGTNNDKDIECFMPSQSNAEDILELYIQDYECDNEQNGQQVRFGGQKYTLYTMEMLEGGQKKCYKTTYNNQTIRFNFIRGYNDNIIQEILGSLNVSV